MTGSRTAALVALAALGCPLGGVAEAAPRDGPTRVVALDDGEKIARDRRRPLPPSPWYGNAIDLFALRGETVAFQVVVEAGPLGEDGVHASMGALYTQSGARLDAVVDAFVERFIEVRRPSGSDREAGSLAFTAASAPPVAAYTGWIADALVPSALAGDARVGPGERAALWFDVTVPLDAPPGTYRGAVLVRSRTGELAALPVALRVVDGALPYAAAKTTIYYEPSTLARRMGSGAASAERELRALLHAHHLSAIHEVTTAEGAARELDALSGAAFTPARGYRGPGEGSGEGVFAIGAYGALGEPNATSLAAAESVARVLREAGVLERTDTFLYAVDEDCASPWGPKWSELARRSEALGGVRVGVTCGVDPSAQAASLVMMTAPELSPARARVARAAPSGKWVWAYNGRRPFAGPMELDVPATDLRANAWIAARYGVDRWFYWESTAWLDANAGGTGGATGHDPFVVAESFHNASGDYANGDGTLVYPGSQREAGFVDYGAATVFPSIRLENLRRGVEDAGYVELARAVDRAETEAIVRRMVPRALALAGERPAWPERGAAWLDARRALADVIERPRADARVGARGDDDARASAAAPRMSQGCAMSIMTNCAGAPVWIALLLIAGGVRRDAHAGSRSRDSVMPRGSPR